MQSKYTMQLKIYKVIYWIFLCKFQLKVEYHHRDKIITFSQMKIQLHQWEISPIMA